MAASSPACASPIGTGAGLVLNIQRMSTEDGPGLRTTAFLKGCPLRCAWCHNPESISPRPEVEWFSSRCIAGAAPGGCGACVRACPAGALSRSEGGAVSVARELCAGCGACVRACPADAMSALGTRYAAQDLVAELRKDEAWFARSDRGGVTLSGGEATAQADFSREVLRGLSEAGVHTALDTCGVASWDRLASLYPFVDLVLWDLKEADPLLHERWTGLSNDLVLENLERTAAWMAVHDRPRAIWIRTPVVPGATARADNIARLGAFLARLSPPRLERWELCAFNNLCADKYRRLGREWSFAATPLMEAGEMEALAETARRALAEGTGGENASARRPRVGPDIVSWTGATAMNRERKQP